MKKNTNKHVLLVGNGKHQHALYGNIAVLDKDQNFSEITVFSESRLQHETPDGKFAEHNTLLVDAGNWVAGQQVEFNPFKGTISRVWD